MQLIKIVFYCIGYYSPLADISQEPPKVAARSEQQGHR